MRHEDIRPEDNCVRGDFTANLQQAMLQHGRYQLWRESEPITIERPYDRSSRDDAAQSDSIIHTAVTLGIVFALVASAFIVIALM